MTSEHAAGEVLERGGTLRLRTGFRDGDGVYAEIETSDLVPGSFIAHRGGVPILDGNAPIVLAKPETALAGVYRIAARAGVVIEFDAASRDEATALARDPRTDDPDLRDLTHLPFVTIDYEHSRDLDQAVYVERTGRAFTVFYALADAASYIAPSSALFRTGLARGTSFYMPGLTVPMLPRVLSEGLISLGADALRRAFVFRIEIDAATGSVGNYELFNAVIRSRAKLTYDGVQAFCDGEPTSPLRDREFSRSLRELEAVGEVRIKEARARDVIRYDRVSASLSLSSRDAETLTVRREARNAAQKWNEQISLVTNIVGAEYLSSSTDESGLAGLFRVHPSPGKAELDGFAGSIVALTQTLGLADSWCWDSDRESLAAYIDRLPEDGQGARLSRALQRQAMLMGRPSSFSTEVGPHYGVGAAAYSRFSSPMREIVGIVTMHIALAQRAGKTLAATGLGSDPIAAAANAGNRAGKLQKHLTRQCNKLAIDQLFGSELKRAPSERPVREATVLGVTENKIYIQLDDPPMEVKLYVPDQERMLGCDLSLVNRFELGGSKATIRVGDAVNVVADTYAEGRERWVLRLVDPT